jgi:hypothetical protein
MLRGVQTDVESSGCLLVISAHWSRGVVDKVSGQKPNGNRSGGRGTKIKRRLWSCVSPWDALLICLARLILAAAFRQIKRRVMQPFGDRRCGWANESGGLKCRKEVELISCSVSIGSFVLRDILHPCSHWSRRPRILLYRGLASFSRVDCDAAVALDASKIPGTRCKN